MHNVCARAYLGTHDNPVGENMVGFNKLHYYSSSFIILIY